MQVKSIAECALLSTFIKLPFVIKICVLSILEWPLKIGFTLLLDFSEGTSRIAVDRLMPLHTSPWSDQKMGVCFHVLGPIQVRRYQLLAYMLLKAHTEYWKGC